MFRLTGLCLGLLIAASGVSFAVVWTGPAAWADTRSDCEQGSRNPDLSIGACTELLKRNPRNAYAVGPDGPRC